MDPVAVALGSSRGYESATSKRIMRLTVVVSDLLGKQQAASGAGFGSFANFLSVSVYAMLCVTLCVTFSLAWLVCPSCPFLSGYDWITACATDCVSRTSSERLFPHMIQT